VDITSLIPTNHTPTTISTHPDFLFSVKSIPNLPVRFSLIEPGVIEPLWKSDIAVNRAGILSVSIPQTVSLDVGKEYVWNLEVVCNPSRPAENWYIRAVIRRVPLKPELAVKLAEADSESEKAVILANNGIWYDAVYYSYKGKNEADSTSYFKQLLSQIGLSI
jgi:hypothetical protein